MKTLSRLIPVCGIVTLALVAAPPIASARTEDPKETTTATEKRPTNMREVFEQAFANVELRPEQQKAVSELMAEAEKRHAPTKAAKGRLMSELADQIERGKIDRCELDARIEKVAKAKAKAKPGDRRALKRLHEILDKTQRAQFVEGLKNAWRALEEERTPASKLDKMTKTLRLTDEQRSKIEKLFETASALRDVEEADEEKREHWSKVLESFKGDDFDLEKVAPEKEDVAERIEEKMNRRLWVAEAVLPILTEEQRTIAAEKLREKARELGAKVSEEEPDDEEKEDAEDEGDEGDEAKAGDEDEGDEDDEAKATSESDQEDEDEAKEE